MEGFKFRVIQELRQLRKKIRKLSDFIKTDKFDKLAENHRDLLCDQLGHMEGYETILTRRVADFGLEDERITYDFAEVIELLKEGHVVSRLCWKDKYIVKQVPAVIEKSFFENMKSFTEPMKEFSKGNVESFTYVDQLLMFSVKGTQAVATYYCPSGIDIFAIDWFIVK